MAIPIQIPNEPDQQLVIVVFWSLVIVGLFVHDWIDRRIEKRKRWWKK